MDDRRTLRSFSLVLSFIATPLVLVLALPWPSRASKGGGMGTDLASNLPVRTQRDPHAAASTGDLNLMQAGGTLSSRMTTLGAEVVTLRTRGLTLLPTWPLAPRIHGPPGGAGAGVALSLAGVPAPERTPTRELARRATLGRSRHASHKYGIVVARTGLQTLLRARRARPGMARVSARVAAGARRQTDFAAGRGGGWRGAASRRWSGQRGATAMAGNGGQHAHTGWARAGMAAEYTGMPAILHVPTPLPTHLRRVLRTGEGHRPSDIR